MTLQEQLDRLAALRVAADRLPNERIEALMRLIPPEDHPQARAILKEFEDLESQTRQQAAELETAIKDHAIRTGEVGQGTYLQLILQPPRVTWDNKSMAVYASLHPEVLAYRKVGEPSVQIRARSLRAV